MPIVRLFFSVLAAMYAYHQGDQFIKLLTGDERVTVLEIALSGMLTLASLALSVWISYRLFVPQKKEL